MLLSESDGMSVAFTAKTPSSVPKTQFPPRINAPGRLLLLEPGPPTQLKSLPKPADQFVQPSARSPHSSTHSHTFPTMSNAPQLDLQLLREPVFTGLPAAEMVQSVVPLSVPGSGVPAAASCHSRFVASRLPDTRHAWAAWNQVVQVLGSTPGMETA